MAAWPIMLSDWLKFQNLLSNDMFDEIFTL